MVSGIGHIMMHLASSPYSTVHGGWLEKRSSRKSCPKSIHRCTSPESFIRPHGREAGSAAKILVVKARPFPYQCGECAGVHPKAGGLSDPLLAGAPPWK